MKISNLCPILMLWILAGACYRVEEVWDTESESVNAGMEVFDESMVHTVELTLSGTDWNAIIDEAEAYENTNPERPYYQAQLIFDGQALAHPIGIRLKGHISIALSREHSFPLKLDFNLYAGDQTLDGLKKLNLNNNFMGPPLTIVRDFVGYHAWREFGADASRTAFAHVTVNGEELGVYIMVEQVDGVFIKQNFSEPFGDLYKPEQITGTLEYRGPHISDYPDIGHKWPDNSDHASLIHAIEVLNQEPSGSIESVFDVESVLTYLAGNVALGVFDYYPITGHNYYLYEARPGQFQMLPWDMNGCLEPVNPEICSPFAGLLSRKLLEDPDHEARYREILMSFLETAGSAPQLTAWVNSAQELIGAAFTEQEFELLRQDIVTRTDWILSEIGGNPTCPQ
jgi:spore coat protein CotH